MSGLRQLFVECVERPIGFVETPDQEKPPGLDIATMRSVRTIAMRFERRPRRAERLQRPAQIARDEREQWPGSATIDREPENDNVLSSKQRKRKGVAGARRNRLARPCGLADLRSWRGSRRTMHPQIALCSSGSSILPIDSMTAMYVLMSLFRLSPWLKPASGRPWART